MNAFEYANPKSVDEAVKLLAGTWGETEVLAGGTDLLSSLKQYLTTPKLVVSLKDVKDLGGIEVKDDALHVGAMATLTAFSENGAARKHFPGLVQACENIGSRQMLNMGTVGGDLLQRPRCWYYRNGLGLLAKQDGESLVEKGDNRYHAIFGNKGDAKFVHPSSLAPGLVALGASIEVQGPKGKRSVSAADFWQTPTSENDRESVLKPNEVVTTISIPLTGLKNGLYEVRQRQGLDWPMVAAFVAFTGDGSSAGHARVVLGHVAPVPWPAAKAVQALNGKNPADEGVRKSVGNAATADASPLSKNGYKVHQARIAVGRAIQAALA